MSRYIDTDRALRMMRNSKQDCPLTDEKKDIWYVAHDCAISCVEAVPTADVVEIPNGKIGDLSDGYHTFNELYHHRAILFSVICNSMPDKAWKSKLHDTGDMFDGMFIVGIETPEGQATYHYDIEPYWDMFKVKELEKAPKWDGHTPQVAIDRISKISADVVEVVRCKDCRFWKEDCVENADTHIPLEELWGVSLPIRSVGIGICECEKFYGDCKDERLKLNRVLNPLETTKDDYCSYGERKEE